MATICKHGGSVGRIDKLTFSMLFCADGKVLRNDGAGWRLWRKLKLDAAKMDGGPAGVYARCRDEYAAKLSAMPAFAHWRRLVHEFPLKKRALVVSAVQHLPEDPDGLWSELEDMGCPVSHGEANALLHAYRMANIEAKEKALAEEKEQEQERQAQNDAICGG